LFGITRNEETTISKELFFDNVELLKGYVAHLRPFEFLYIRFQPYMACINFKPIRLYQHVLSYRPQVEAAEDAPES
jgi:hypothetical protein